MYGVGPRMENVFIQSAVCIGIAEPLEQVERG